MTATHRCPVSFHGRITFGVAALLLVGSCSEGTAPRTPTIPSPPAAVTISEPVAATPAALSLEAGPLRVAAADEMVYVSFPPGTFPGATLLRISRGATSISVTLEDGGLDPVPIPAAVGDTISLDVTDPTGVHHYVAVAPAARRPRVVRTIPPHGRTDLPLNSVIIIVFTEPIDPATADSIGLWIESAGQRLATTISVSTDGLQVFLTPTAPLPTSTSVTVRVTGHVTDRAGDALEEELTAVFGTAASPPPPPAPLLASAIAAGANHTCAVGASGTTAEKLLCWGITDGWRGTPAPRPSPYPSVASKLLVSAASAQTTWTCALQSAAANGFPAGTAVCGGRVEYQPGWILWIGIVGLDPVTVPVRGPAFVSLDAGDRHTCGVTAGGALHCWGANEAGQLGTGTSSFASQFLNPTGDTVRIVPVQVAMPRTWRGVAVGRAHTCGLTTSADVICWGAWDRGQLGVPAADGCALQGCGPVGNGRFTEVAAGSDHTCAISDAGAAWCWGQNKYRQLATTAVQVSPEPRLVPGGPYVHITAGARHTCAIDTAGHAWCWGDNLAGQLGDSTLVSRSTPTAVRTDQAFVELTAGLAHTCGRTAASEVYCWGDNSSGQVGTSVSATEIVPIRVRTGP